MGDLQTPGENTGPEQYLRKCELIVYGNDLQGINLSALRIKFSVKRSDVLTPNVADIRVYNLAEETAKKIFSDYSSSSHQKTGLINNRGRIILQAGYGGNFGVIFQGNIKQVILGRESATDTFIDLSVGDGDWAYNFAVVNTTLKSGSTQTDQVNAAIGSMTSKGVTAGAIGAMPNDKLPRGKVLYGDAKNVLRQSAQSTGKTVSIQDEKVSFIPITSYLPGERVVLTSKTGMVGTPNQTTEGVNVKCLLNPLIRVGGQIQIDNASIAQYKINIAVPGSPSNTPTPLTADGVYYVMAIEYTGDTRGVDWYSTILAINKDVTTNPLNSVANYGP